MIFMLPKHVIQIMNTYKKIGEASLNDRLLRFFYIN